MSHDGQEDPAPVASAGVTIEFDASPVISLAMVHNRVQPVRNIEVTNAGADLTGAELALVVQDDEGVLSAPSQVVVDLPHGATVQLDEVALQMDPSALLEMEERRHGTLSVVLTAGGDLVASETRPVTVLAGRQWLSEPPGLAMELLAAHVMPNSPVVETLLTEASALLKERTGSPSVQGYQAGPERVDQIVQATFDAMRAREIRYANPPASWSDQGQKVRTPEEVLDGRVGTCLDTTVVMAAAMEQAGIHPLLWVVQGHSFVGWWREEQMALDAIATSDASPMVNLIDLGLMGVIETTLVADGSTASAQEAMRAPLAIARKVDEVLGVVDLHAARQSGIVALPSRRRTPSGEVQITEYHPVQHSTPMPALDGSRTSRPEVAATEGKPVPPRVQQWKNALLDLSLRNRLINFTARHTVELVIPDAHLGAVEDVLHDGRPVRLLASDAIDAVHAARGHRWARDLPEEHVREEFARRNALHTDVTSQAYAGRLRNLAYRARTIEEETGANNLYLAMGSLVWRLDGRELRSPLILVPVKLVATGRGDRTSYRLRLDEAGGSTPNYCLLEKLKQTHGIQIPELAEPKEDLSGIDLEATLDAVRRVLATKGLPFHVEDTAHVAVLQFAKFRLWKDLDEQWESLLENPLAAHLAHTPTEVFVDPAAPARDATVDLDELAAACPIPADSSQLRAIDAAVRGQTFVIEGPPGTGKSQTITNLLARSLAAGKRVLFVAEKRAALDVVKQRLDAIGLDPFSLDLHDKSSRPATVRAQLKAAIDHRAVVDSEGLSVAGEELRTAGRALSRYRSQLHATNAADLSLYSAHTRSLALGEATSELPVPPELLGDGNGQRLKGLRSLLVSLPEVAVPARPKAHHPWGFVQVDDVPEGAWPQLAAAVRQISGATELLQQDVGVGAVVRAAATVGELEVLARIVAARRPRLGLLDETRTPRWQEATRALRAEVATFVAAAHPGLDVATPAALGLPLTDIHARARAAAESSWFGRKKRLRAVVDELQPGLKADAQVHHKQVLELTGALVQVQSAVRAMASRARSIPGLMVPEAWNPLTEAGQQLLNSQIQWLEWAGEQVTASGTEATEFVQALREFIGSDQRVPHGVAQAVHAVSAGLSMVSQHLGVDEEAWRTWSTGASLMRRWAETEEERASGDPQLPSLRRWLDLRAYLQPLTAAGMGKARQLLLAGVMHPDEAPQAFDRGVAHASLWERARASGLDSFDTEAHERTIARFTHSSGVVRALVPGQIQRDVVGHRPFHTGASAGKVGGLQRELERRRGGLPVRSLLETYGEIITRLMPCVLVSPDSLARFFPVSGDLFDIVVFDEASQIRVADAIGAIGRAKSVVVVGDSKQMPPTSFAESTIVSGEDADEMVGAAMVEDQESILSEAVQARVDRHWLSWHYRSRDEALIAFSNKHYYLGKLSSFPPPTSGSSDPGVHGYGISLVRVNGTFHRDGKGKLLRTNPVEADVIVADVVRRFDAHRGEGFPSVGIVTFNQQQRAHIEALVRDHEDSRLVEALDSTEDEGLFIKNLENVQGDERDVILFSTAFSVNAKGVLPLNFGPLNREGGERRLNVAITRARRQVVIYSSFDPAQLRAEETSSTGIAHLRAYLDLAAEGTAKFADEIRRTGETDRHREDVARALRERGIQVTTDIGLSDFRVDLALATAEQPDRRLVAVVLDGPGWAGRQTVGDRDGLPVSVLEGMLEWPAVTRVWLPAWLADPESVLDDLDACLSRAASLIEQRLAEQQEAINTKPTAPQVPAPVAREHLVRPETVPPALDDTEGGLADVDPAPLSEGATGGQVAAAPSGVPSYPAGSGTITEDEPVVRLEGEEPFCSWEVTRRGPRSVLDGLPEAHSRREVGAVISEVVATEGPVNAERLSRLVAAAFDLFKVSRGRSEDILRCVPAGWRVGEEADVIWDGRDVSGWRAFRSDADGIRDIEQVPLREIANSMRSLCLATGGIARDELMRESLALFGFRRMTVRVSGRMEEALAFAVRAELIQLDADYYREGRRR